MKYVILALENLSKIALLDRGEANKTKLLL